MRKLPGGMYSHADVTYVGGIDRHGVVFPGRKTGKLPNPLDKNPIRAYNYINIVML